MPINEALFAAMKAASYIKPNAGKSYKLQRVAEELIAKQAPANPKCRVEDAFAPMADGYAVPLRVFTPLVAYGAPLPEALEESSANGTPVASAISAILPAVLPKVLPKIPIKESTSSGNTDGISAMPTRNFPQSRRVARSCFSTVAVGPQAASTCTRRLARIWPYVCNAV